MTYNFGIRESLGGHFIENKAHCLFHSIYRDFLSHSYLISKHHISGRYSQNGNEGSQ